MRWVTFDCFGTLIDWRHGIATSADLIAPGRGAELLDLYTKHEQQVQTESPTLRYRHVLAESLSRACTEAGVPLLDDDAAILATTLPYWPPFPDTRQALTDLRAAGYRLALLTNCDRDLIAQTLRRLQVPIDATITAEDTGAYKPAPNHFRRFQESLAPDNWVHVAQSHHHDIVPTAALGIPRIWINRHNSPNDPSLATAVLPNLTELLRTIDRITA